MKDDKYLDQLNGILVGLGVTRLWSLSKFDGDPKTPVTCWCNTQDSTIAYLVEKELPKGSLCMVYDGSKMKGYRCIYKDGMFMR